jgi:hypothetical protein
MRFSAGPESARFSLFSTDSLGGTEKSRVKKISSSWTFFHKKIFPVFWFGFIALFVLTVSAAEADQLDAMFLVIPAFMAIVGFVLLKKLVWDLLDEVYDCGDFLLIKNQGEEDEVALSNIMNVSPSTFTNPPRVTLRLANPSRFGNEIVFSPVTGFSVNPFAKNAVAEDLMVRVDRARSRRAV